MNHDFDLNLDLDFDFGVVLDPGWLTDTSEMKDTLDLAWMCLLKHSSSEEGSLWPTVSEEMYWRVGFRMATVYFADGDLSVLLKLAEDLEDERDIYQPEVPS